MSARKSGRRSAHSDCRVAEGGGMAGIDRHANFQDSFASRMPRRAARRMGIRAPNNQFEGSRHGREGGGRVMREELRVSRNIAFRTSQAIDIRLVFGSADAHWRNAWTRREVETSLQCLRGSSEPSTRRAAMARDTCRRSRSCSFIRIAPAISALSVSISSTGKMSRLSAILSAHLSSWSGLRGA